MNTSDICLCGHKRSEHVMNACLFEFENITPARCQCNEFRLDPNAIASGWNPAGLTQAQVGIAEGWRLLEEDEITTAPRAGKLQVWFREVGKWGSCMDLGWARNTYRTRLTRAELRAARGLEHEPGEVTKCAVCGSLAVENGQCSNCADAEREGWFWHASKGRFAPGAEQPAPYECATLLCYKSSPSDSSSTSPQSLMFAGAYEAIALLEKNHMGGQLLEIVKDRLAAEVELGEGEYEGADGMEDVIRWMKQERDEARAEVERLKSELHAALHGQ